MSTSILSLISPEGIINLMNECNGSAVTAIYLSGKLTTDIKLKSRIKQEINKVLYNLEKQGRVKKQQPTSNSKPLWSFVSLDKEEEGKEQEYIYIYQQQPIVNSDYVVILDLDQQSDKITTILYEHNNAVEILACCSPLFKLPSNFPDKWKLIRAPSKEKSLSNVMLIVDFMQQINNNKKWKNKVNFVYIYSKDNIFSAFKLAIEQQLNIKCFIK